jgi:hypothetical protein
LDDIVKQNGTTRVATRSRTGQRLKPDSSGLLYGTAEAVPYKVFAGAEPRCSLSSFEFCLRRKNQKKTG